MICAARLLPLLKALPSRTRHGGPPRDRSACVHACSSHLVSGSCHGLHPATLPESCVQLLSAQRASGSRKCTQHRRACQAGQGSSQGGGDSDTSRARPLLHESLGGKTGRPNRDSLGASGAEVPLGWGQGRVRRHSQQPKAGKNRNLLETSTGPGQGGGEPTPFPLFRGAQHSGRAWARCPWRCQVDVLMPKCFRSCSRNKNVSTVWGMRRMPAGKRPL